jgi:hypothetical protein
VEVGVLALLLCDLFCDFVEAFGHHFEVSLMLYAVADFVV